MQIQHKKRTFPVIWLWIGGVALAVIVLSLVIALLFNTGVRSDRYQLIKLTTGEIFFGKLTNIKGEYMVLENAYFIQESETSTETTILSRNATVAKSESPMRIKSDQVVYWENLASDSKIADTIKNATGN